MKLIQNFVFTFVFLVGIFSTAVANTTIPEDGMLTVRVVDMDGNLVLETEVSVEKFLDQGSEIEVLPQGSVFLLYRGNVAYFMVSKKAEEEIEL